MYNIEIRPAAQRDIKKLSPGLQRRITSTIRTLSIDPRLTGVKKLKGYQNRYRIRVEDYRIIYEIDDNKIVVIIIRVRHRKDVYRK